MSAMGILGILGSAIGLLGGLASLYFRNRCLPEHEMFWMSSFALLWLGTFQLKHAAPWSTQLFFVQLALFAIQFRAWRLLSRGNEGKVRPLSPTE